MAINIKTPKRGGKIRFNVTLTAAANRCLGGLARMEARSKSNMLEVLIQREATRSAPQKEAQAA